MYRTEPEPGLNGRALIYPRGKTLGGCSAINGMISMRGQAEDYRNWRQEGLDGWGWEDVQPVFRAIDAHYLGDSEHHAGNGDYRVEQQRLSWEVLDAIRDAAAEMGVAKVDDFNTGDNEGVSYFQVNQQNGRRWSAARGYLDPAKGRPNLRIETHALIDRVTFDGKRATGIVFHRDGRTFGARARGEILLSAGSVASPMILQRSGIGRAEWLGQHGIETIHALPGVGGNLQDHLQQRAIYRVSNVKTLNETYHSLLGKASIGLNYALFRRGPMTMAPSQLGMFTRSSPDHDRANIQFHIQPLSLDKFGDPLHRFPAVTVSACNLRPTSRGTNDPAAQRRPERSAGDRAELSEHAGRPHSRCRRHPRDPPPDGPERARKVSAGRASAWPIRGRRSGVTGEGRGRHRHHHLPPGWHRKDGPNRRPQCRG